MEVYKTLFLKAARRRGRSAEDLICGFAGNLRVNQIKKDKKMKKALFISAILASLAFAAPYGVDVSHTNVGFKVKHMMISSTNGKFKSFSGTFDYDEATKSVSNIKGKIAVASIDTDDAKRDAHL